MTSYVITYRGVKGANLTANEFDANNHNLDDRVTVLESLDLGIGIDHFDISGTELSVTMSDSSVLGPYTVPTAQWNFRGAWDAGISYVVNDVVSAYGSLYLVIYAHTSATSFDAGDNDGLGHDYYQLLLQNPAIPSYERTDTTFTPELADANSYNRCTNASGCLVTIPAESDVDFPLWTELHFRQCGVGAVTIDDPTTASGIVINGMTGFINETADEGAVLTLKKIDADEWDCFGRLAVAPTA